MRKLLKISRIAVIFIIALMASACSMMPGMASSRPVVEIVERSDLLDIIDIDYIINEDIKFKLMQYGITAEMKNLTLTSDYTAEFDFILTGTGGRNFRIKLPVFINYDRENTENGDIFSNIDVYRGEIGFHDSRTLLISGTKSVTGLDIADFSSTVVDLSDIIPDGDYIVNMAVDSRYGFCVIYRDGDTDNLVIYDLLGNLIDTVTLSSVESDDISADPDSAVPFDIAGRPIIEYCRGGNILVATDKTAYFYNTGEKSCLYGGNPVAHGETSGIQLSLYSLVPQIDSMGKVHSDMYMVVQRSADNADCIVFDKRVLGCTLHPKEIYYSDNGPVLRCRRTGMKMNLDFRNEKIDTIGYSITDDMLMEKLYVSADRGYRIYGYAPENHSGITAYNFALKQLSTGKTCYIGCAGLINGSYSGEAGFLPDGRVYVLGDNDYCIYSTDINDHQPQFVLSDHIDLGENVNTDLEDRILVAAMSDQNGMITAVYYDIKNEEENNFIDDKGLRLKSCYKVAIFDASGRLLRYYNTPLNAVAGYNPVNIYQIGNSLTITVTYQGTGTVISKGVLNYSNNMFTATVMDNPV